MATDTSKEIEFNEDKFKELILHIAIRCADEKYYSATKLNKILFYSDFLAYKLHGEPITGAEYFALKRGPAPRHLVPVREAMEARRDIAIEKHAFQHRVVALREPSYEEFSAKEIALVDQVIDALRGADAESVSNLSHLFLGWQAAIAEGVRTSIPYETVFALDPPMDEYEEAYGLALAKKHGW